MLTEQSKAGAALTHLSEAGGAESGQRDSSLALREIEEIVTMKYSPHNTRKHNSKHKSLPTSSLPPVCAYDGIPPPALPPSTSSLSLRLAHRGTVTVVQGGVRPGLRGTQHFYPVAQAGTWPCSSVNQCPQRKPVGTPHERSRWLIPKTLTS